MNCSFCGDEVVPGTGKMYVRRDGTVLHFCKAKCQRNMVVMGRVNRHVGWTKAYADHKSDRITANTAASGAGHAKAAKGAAAKETAAKATAAKATAKATESAGRTATKVEASKAKTPAK